MTAAGFYHCSVKGVGRANGRSIVAAAAYRSGERLVDEWAGQTADYRARGGVMDSFIIAPDAAPAWAHDRERLWNAAERAETRANGRLATELELALPHDLTAAQRKELLMDFLAPIIERYGTVADVAIHEPGEGKDHRNIHAHVLFTHRTLDEDGFVEKVKGQRKDIGLSTFAMGSEAVLEIRQAWEQHVNRAYERAGLDIRVDHRSHADRGIAQEPTKHLGPSASAMERREPGSSDRGDINRDIEERNAALRERAALEIAATKAQAELAAARQLAEMERAAAAEREARAAAAGRRDEIRPAFDMAARTTEPAAPIHDREAAEAAWQKQIIDAAAQAEREARAAATGRKDDTRAPAQEARQPPEPIASMEKHGAAELAQTPPQAQERAWQPAPEPGGDLKSPESIFAQSLGGIGKWFAGLIEGLADFLAPPPPPTRDQAERMARAAEERQEAQAHQNAQAERAEAQHWLIAEAQRAAREREEEERFRSVMQKAAREDERDRDRGYERER